MKKEDDDFEQRPSLKSAIYVTVGIMASFLFTPILLNAFKVLLG